MIVLFNPAAGLRPPEPQRIEAVLGWAGIKAEVRRVLPARLSAEARRAAGQSPDALVAAGGDGTVSTVAAAVAETGIPLGVLPTGTLNHFARDLGLPADLEGAAAVLAAGKSRAVDVAEVNGRCFINNSSIGLYPHIVRRRDGLRQRLGRGKSFAMVIAVLSVFRRYPRVHVRIDVAGQVVRAASPLVFVGNNRYEFDLLNLGRRPTLDRGELGAYLANAPTRLSFVRLGLRLLAAAARQPRDFLSIEAPSLTIETRRRRLRVALDGEVTRMRPPLHYRIRPGALRVLAP